MKSVHLFYVHDPMCSWCWGFKPRLEELKQALATKYPQISFEPVLGGLAPDSDEVMPEQMQGYLKQTWQRIHQELGTEFNFEFWDKVTPVRATYPACRAVLAAQKQGAGEAMNDAIQEAYYLHAKAPHLIETHLELAAQLDLNVEMFHADLLSPEIEAELGAQLDFAKALQASGFPSLIFAIKSEQEGEASFQIAPVQIDYKDVTGMLTQLDSYLKHVA